MIKTFIYSLIFILFIKTDKCDLDSILEKNISKLDAYTFAKKFELFFDKKKKKNENSYVFSRDSEYKILILDSETGNEKINMKLYDRDHKLIATNKIGSRGKVFNSITYKCSATGVYYFETFFDEDREGCGLNIIGFKNERKNFN